MKKHVHTEFLTMSFYSDDTSVKELCSESPGRAKNELIKKIVTY